MYKFRVPGQRGRGQTLVAFPLDEELLAALDQARGPLSRSAILRKALFDHLRAKGYQLDESLIAAPDRAGKGGRTKSSAPALLNESKDKAESATAPKTKVKYTRPPRKRAGGGHGS